MTRCLSIAALALLASVAVARSTALPPLESYTLHNGLNVVLARDPEAATVDVSVCYAAGADWEKPGQAGITPLYERMLFQGSKQFGPGEIVRRLTTAGATFNTSSNADGVTLWQTLPPEALELVLRIEADRMAGATLDPATIEREKRSVREDRLARFDRGIPGGLRRLYALLFPGHPYGRGAIGDGTELARITPRDLAAWGRARFAPNTATLIIAGRFESDPVRARIGQLFGPIPGRGSATSPHPPFTAPVDTVEATEPGDIPLSILLVGWRGPGAADPDAPAFELLARILASHSGARLERALVRDTSLVASVQTNVDRRRDASLLWALAVIRPDADSGYVSRTLLAEVRRLAMAAPTPDELERARRPLLLNEYLQWQLPHLRAQALSEAVLESGDPHAAETRLTALQAVQPGDIQRVAQRFLAASPRATVWLSAAAREEGR